MLSKIADINSRHGSVLVGNMWVAGKTRGVNPYGTEGTRPPNVLVGGDANDNVPPIIRRNRLD